MVCVTHFWVPTYNPSHIHVVPGLVETLYISTYSVCINHNHDFIFKQERLLSIQHCLYKKGTLDPMIKLYQRHFW